MKYIRGFGYLLIVSSCFFVFHAAHAAWTYYSPITVTSSITVASGTQTNFPLYISIASSSYLQSTSTGGAVYNASGYDIIFSTSTTCGNSLGFITEAYTSSTGQLIAQVNLPTMTAGSVIYMCYGNSSVTSSQASSSMTGNSSLVGYWPLDEGTGTMAYDDSGNNATGTWHGNATGTSGYYSAGKVGNWAGAFDGTSTYISVPNSTALSPSSVTVSAWVKISSIPAGNAGIITKDLGGGVTNPPYNLQVGGFGSTEINFSIGNTSSTAITCSSPSSIGTSTWHYLAGTYNAATATGTLYIDGASVCTFSQTNIGTNTGNVNIGQQKAGFSRFFPGLIDDARVYNSAFSPDEVLDLYNNQNSPTTFYTLGNQSLLTPPPTLAPSTASSISTSTATLNGTITSIGNATATVEGFNYGTSTAYGLTVSSTGSFATGTFNQSISGLLPSTLYHFQAYATNSNGTGTSTDATFTTVSTTTLNIFYSVGQSNSVNLMTGSSTTLTITSGASVFSIAQTGNIGVGDQVSYGTSSIAYISGKTNSSDLDWTLVTATGATPPNVTGATVNSIYRAFSSLSAAISGAVNSSHLNNTNLVAANVILNIPCYYDSGPDKAGVSIPSSTITGASNYINIYTPNNTSTQANFSQRHVGKWTTNAYQLVSTNNGSAALDIRVNYVRIVGLQIMMVETATSTVTNGRGIRMENLPATVTTSTSQIVIDSNIVRYQISNVPADDAGIANFNNNGAIPTVDITNNIIYDITSGTTTDQGIFMESGNYFVYNNTTYNNYDGYSADSNGGNTVVTYINNIAQDDGSAGYNDSITVTSSSTDNLSDQQDAPGINPKDLATVFFVSTSTRDLHLAPFNPLIEDGGTSLAADPNYAFSYDINGQARPYGNAWDIGADEYYGATYAYTPPTITSFTMPVIASSVVVSVNSFTATSIANPAVAYFISESPSTPSPSNPNWLATVPSTFTFGGSGTRTAYAWTMDAYGDISSPVSQSVTITPHYLPVTSSPLPSAFFSMNWNHYLNPISVNASSDWPSVSFGGIRLWENGVTWDEIETASGTYTWTNLHSWMAAAQASGTDLLYTFGRVPQWASSNPTQPCTAGNTGCAAPPLDIGSGDNIFKTFVTALVEQSLASPTAHIKYYELWNEPDDTATWTGTYAQMVTMATDAYNIIHTLDPNAVVVGPGFGTSLSWLQNYYAAGGSVPQDVVAFHAYFPILDPTSVFPLITNIRTLMSQYGISNEPLWITEGNWYGYGTDYLMSNSQDANYLAQEYMYMWSQNIGRYYWYAWDNTTYGTLWDSTNGIHADGVAYGLLYNWLVGSTHSPSPCSMSADTTWYCTLTLANGDPAEILWNLNGTTTKSVSPVFTTYQTLYNANVNPIVADSVSIGSLPMLLVDNGTIGPVVSSFIMPSSAISLTVPVTSFLATDVSSTISGYLITTSATAPSPTDPGWSAIPPTSFTFSGYGTETAYAWALDVAGNVSAAATQSVTVSIGISGGSSPANTVSVGAGGTVYHLPPPATSMNTNTSSTAELQAFLSSLEAEFSALLQLQKASSEPVSISSVSISAVTSTSPFVFTRNVSIGSSGPDVKALQHYLNTHGFLISTIPGNAGSLGYETQYFGLKTQEALAAFQRVHGITPALGYFEPITRAYLNAHE